MTTNFPALCPTARSFTPGQFAVKRFTSISGAGETRLYGSKPFDSSLQLTFLLNDADLQLLMNCWNQAYGSFDILSLPDSLFNGLSNGVRAEIASSLNWRWAKRPEIQSVVPGRNRATVNLVANLDA